MTFSTSEYIRRTSREYALYVNDFRSIPSSRDGLKMAQRIALWLMRDVSAPMTTMAFVGRMIESKLYVHGDASAAEMVSMMAAPYLNNVPVITGRGGFGTRSKPKGIGSPRYTKVMRSKFAEDVIYCDIDSLPMVDNYDQSAQMPDTFLPMIPLSLLNGVVGIGVGWRSLILPRSFDDIQAAIIEYLRKGKIRNKLIPSYAKYDVTVEAGDEPGRYIVSGKFERVKSNTIRITELCPTTSKGESWTTESYREHLIELEEAGKIRDFIDHSRDKIDIIVKFPGGVLETLGDDEIYKMLALRSTFTEGIIVIDHARQKVVEYPSPANLIMDFVDWRLSWYKDRYQRMVATERGNIQFWLSYIACHTGSKKTDSVPSILSKIESKAKLRDHMRSCIADAKINPDDQIIERLADMAVHRWTKNGLVEARTAIEKSTANITEYEAIIRSPDRQKGVFLEEIGALSVR